MAEPPQIRPGPADPHSRDEGRQLTDYLVGLAVRLHGLLYAATGGAQIDPEQGAEVEELVAELTAHDLAVHAPGAAAVVHVARRLLDENQRRG